MKELREDRRPADLWFWSDWFSSVDLRSCSLAARGLWADMLGIMSRSDRKGYLSINGRPMDSKELAKFSGEFKDKVEELLVELEYYRVFSRDEDGTIYNRRMVRESDLSKKRAEAGRRGGLKQTRSKPQAKDGSKPEATLESDSEYDSYSSIKEKDFDLWWSRYPRKVAKKVAARAYAAVIKGGASPGDLLRAIGNYVAELRFNKTELRYIKHPATFLHEERWRDYLEAPEKKPDVGASGKREHDDAYWAEVRRKHAEGKKGDDHE
jgi:hypothetical protein